MKKKLILAVLAATLAGSLLAGCGNKAEKAEVLQPVDTEETTAEEKTETNETVTEEPVEEVKKVTVGTGITYNPYCFIDENNELAGFDVELLKAVDEYLEDYEFTIEGTAINDLLLGLDSGTYSLISHSLNKTPEREEKYLFSNEDTGLKNFWIIAKTDSDINTFEDLVGKKVLDKPGKSFYNFVDEYNKSNPDKTIVLEGIDDLTAADRIKYIAEGRYDASADNRISFENANAQIGADVEIKGLAFSSPTYFLYAQGQEELRDRVDEALVELKANGTLSELSLKWLGEDAVVDYSSDNNN